MAGKTPELPTTVAFDDGFGGTLVIGGDSGRPLGYRLPAPDQVLEFQFHEALDAWTSNSGATYFGAGLIQWPLVRYQRGAFELLPPQPPTDGLCIAGVDGPTPADDVLFCLAEKRPYNQPSSCELHWRAGRVWKRLPVGHGQARAIVVEDQGKAVYLGTGSVNPHPGSLLRFAEGKLESLRLPEEEAATLAGSSLAGLAALGGGELLVLFAHWDEPARPWLRSAAGTWSPLESPELRPWLGRIRTRRWRGQLYLPTRGGVFVFEKQPGAPTTLRRETRFDAISLWPTALGLLCRGWKDGTRAHEIDDGTGWRPFSVPEPDVVRGGRGKVMSLGRRELPVVKPRLPKPRPEGAAPAAQPDKATDVKPRPFALSAFLGELAGHEGVKRRPKPRSTVADLERFHGTKLAPDLRQYLALYETHRLDGVIGQWRVWSDERDTLLTPPPTTSPETLLSAFYESSLSPYPVIAALTGTYCLGSDGSGDVYYAEVGPRASAVYVYGHDVGSLRVLTTSFTAWAALNDVDEQWHVLREIEGVDEDALEDDSLPGLAAIRAAARALKGAVNLADAGSDVSTDYDETIQKLARRKLVLKNAAPALDRCARAEWLISWLRDPEGWSVGWVPAEAKRVRSIGPASGAGSLACDRVYALWHAFVFDRPELPKLLAAARKDRAALVKLTGGIFEAADDTAGRRRKAFASLRALREKVRGAG